MDLPDKAAIAKLPADGGPEFNRLVFARSPYLRQHARNPVDWYPWGEAAFAKARAENKPVFLSIGYSTCHWCHVMERESFEDAEVARLLNAHFVAVKVDREERPDIDHVYMMVTQAMTGAGGWPMSVFLTPELRPFYAGTYFPKESRLGRPGMLRLLPAIAEAWAKDRDGLCRTAAEIEDYLRQQTAGTEAGDLPGADLFAAAADALRRLYDADHGGFGQAPKFPTPHQLTFLLRHWRRTGDEDALAMVEHTLTAMYRGGIFDQLGGGFHRYSTDREWLLPHFEKMLYDQALITIAALETHQATGRATYARIARRTLDYVRRELTAPEGGFTSAEDADSEGVEGRFYLWTTDQLHAVLGADEAEDAARFWDIRPGGNFTDPAAGRRTGENVLHRALSGDDPAEAERREALRRALFAARETRVHPFKDDKVLTDWNGLMIAAFARAAAVLGDPAYAATAARAADFALTALRRPDGRLWKCWRAGVADLPACLDDYAFLIWGLVELYQADFAPRWLAAAVELAEQLPAAFRDAAGGALFMTAADGEPLLVRARTLYDGAVPSGNAVAAENLLRLSRLTGRADFATLAEDILRAAAHHLRQQPTAHTQMLQALDFALGPSAEIVIAGDAPEPFLAALRGLYLPRAVRLCRPPGDAEILRLAPDLEALGPVGGQTAAYVCRDFTCAAPVTDPAALPALLTRD